MLDFGLARVASGELAAEDKDLTLAPVTQFGVIVGTMPYMSPEQVEGRSLDPRSDLFSLGVIFYELLTGSRPFQGASSASVMSAILRDRPIDLSSRRGDVPEALARVIARCLEKQPDDRVQTARDVYNELRHVQKQLESSDAGRPHAGSGSLNAVPRDALSISVAPFQARNGDETAMTLADGLRDDVTTGLSRFRHFRVVSADARYRLEGSVRIFGTSLRVSVRVADAQNGANIWADNYDRDLASGVFALQDEISSRIVATVGDLTGVLANAMTVSLAGVPLDQLSANELVLRYQEYAQPMRATDHATLRAALERALEREPRAAEAWACLALLVVRFHLFTAQLRADEHERLRGARERALQHEPSAAEGWACLAHLYGQEHSLHLNPRPDSVARERHAAERAVELNPQSPLAWTALARAHLFARDLPALRGAVDRAISLNPLNADMLAHCAIFLTGAGDMDRAADLVRRAQTLKPHHQGWFHFPVFNVHYARGEYEDALNTAKQINMPLVALANMDAAAAAGQLGRAAEARASIERLRQYAPAHLDVETARGEWRTWLSNDAHVDRLVDGFSKALALAQ